MKSLAHPSFFRTFDLLLSTSNRGLKLSRWSHDGVAFERERHSFSGPNHGLTIEIVTLIASSPITNASLATRPLICSVLIFKPAGCERGIKQTNSSPP